MTTFGPGAAQTLPYGTPGRDRFEYGPADFDHAHRLVLSYVWQSPQFTGSNVLMRTLQRDWELTGILSLQTGGPITILAGADQSRSGLTTDRAFYLGGPVRSDTSCGRLSPSVNYLNTSAFVLPALGTFGNVGRGALRGPELWNLDMGVSRNVRLREGVRLQLPLTIRYPASMAPDSAVYCQARVRGSDRAAAKIVF